MSLVLFAEQELKLIGMGEDATEENKLMHDDIIEIVKKFADQGHSGFSASYALGILTKLMNYEALTPLTGADDEWTEIGEGQAQDDMKYQNKRCYSVFKGSDGRAYDSNTKVYYEKGNRSNTYTKGGERTYITFPYTHKVEYVEDVE
ncbi:hypothetical protein HZA56_14130 [Candidatus Poribacteria bacterium]|nr:hypothetical protein [Candidatus Poribacteria bacterium]